MPTSVVLPAIMGGEPLFPKGPPDWPGSLPEVQDALKEAWATGTWGKYNGPLVEKLQEVAAAWLGRTHALAVSSGTLGIELALKALGIADLTADKVGVALCDYDYPGNFLTIHHVGAVPILIDTDPFTGQMCERSLTEAIRHSKIPIKAVIVSTLHGSSPDLAKIGVLLAKSQIPWIADACQAVGGSLWGHRQGSLGIISIWSFGGSKHMSAGRGGMVFTNDSSLAQRMRLANTRGSVVGGLSELQAAAILAQWPQLEPRHSKRAHQADILRSQLSDIPGLLLPLVLGEPANQAYYKFDFWLDASPERFDWVFAALKAEGLAVERGFRSLSLGRSPSRFYAPVTLDISHANTPNRLVLHHPILLESGSGEKIARAIRRVVSHQ